MVTSVGGEVMMREWREREIVSEERSIPFVIGILINV
jgi:hypothetical protein